MRFGLQVYTFTWARRPQAIGPTHQSVTQGSASAWRSATESVDRAMDRFGRPGDSGVQQGLLRTADLHSPATIERPAVGVMPQLVEVGAGQT